MTIQELLDLEIAYMGSNWVEDATVTDGPFPGQRYVGEIACINCNDVFLWAVADSEKITEETLPEFNKALEDCKKDVSIAAILYCARRYKMRPQGAFYQYIPEEFWPLFDECGPEREIDFFNPCDKNGKFLYKEKDE